MTAVEADDRTRVVINLAQLVPYEVSTSGDTISLTLDSLPADLKTATVEEPTMPGAATGASISDIDFRRGPKGEAQVIVDLSAPDVGINITQQGEDVIVDFAETKLPESLDRKLDVGDFATPAREIDTFPHGNGTRMVIKPTGLYEHLAYQSDNVFTLELRELTKAEEEQLKKDKFTFTGERLSLNFQNIEAAHAAVAAGAEIQRAHIGMQKWRTVFERRIQGGAQVGRRPPAPIRLPLRYKEVNIVVVAGADDIH